MANRGERFLTRSDQWRIAGLTVLTICLVAFVSLVCGIFGAALPVRMKLTLIEPWSFSLGQVAFGLTTAILAIALPQLAVFHEWWYVWHSRMSENEPTIDDALVSGLERLVAPADIRHRLGKREHQRLLRRLGSWKSHSRDDYLKELLGCVSVLRHLIEQKRIWESLVKKAGLENDPYLGAKGSFRAEFIAELSVDELHRLYKKITADTAALCILTIVLGLLSLTPDPFYYFITVSTFSGMDPGFSAEPRYPMFALVLPAVVMLIGIAYLGFRVGQAYGEMRRLNPAKFDESMWGDQA